MIKESHLNIVHLPGEAVEFDWGTIKVQIGENKQTTKISLAVFSFPYSNYKKAYVLNNCNSESFVIAFKKFVKEINGVPPLFILDNMRIARKFSSKENSEVKLTTLFDNLCKHYQFKVQFCSPYCPNQKGNVENNVGVLKKKFEQSYIHSFDTIGEVEEYVNQIIGELNAQKHPRKNDTCVHLFNHEKNRLLPLPQKDYIYFHERGGKVSRQGMIRFDYNYYAVSDMFKGEEILVKYNEKSIYFFTKDGEDVIAKYSRVKQKGKKKHRIWYMLNKLKNKSNGFMDSEEYKSMSKAEKILLEKIFKYDCSEFLTFIEIIKDRPRDFIRKFVYTFKNRLEDFTVDRLLNEVLKI